MDKKSDAANREEKVLQFWRENKIFEKSLEQTEGKKEFVFFEGPPTANGKPGMHHLEARAFKDAIPRYKTMRGFHVRRKAGWDTHGLPVELQVEKKLGLNSKKAIEEYGIAKFNQQCKESVWEYLDVWNKFTTRIGYWLDQENPYVTYHNDYIESVWNIVKKINEQKLLYKDYKVVPWCPRCGTALSSHELAQGYEDVKDLSVYVKFKIKGETPRESNTSAFLLAWTTTPWTLPGNVGLAVGKNIIYVEIKVGEEIYVLAKERLSVITEPYEIIAEHKGAEMVGMQYEPLYPFLGEKITGAEKEKIKNAYKVYPADFVTTADGTGIVHTAVMYGQDDFELGTKVGLPKYHMVGLDGKFLAGTEFLEGRFVRDEEVAVDIIKDLAHRGLLYKKEKYQHSYPHCWRCHTALIYYARDSWYIKVSDEKIKSKMIVENKGINWEPSHIKEGRFGEWLREIKDWAISRERYWGTPLPVWTCESCKETEVLGSVEEIKNKTKKSGNKYFVMRHGGSRANELDTVSFAKEKDNHLTEKGKAQVSETASKLRNKKIDLIVSSPFVRTRETSAILKEKLNLKDGQVVFDDRLHEVNPGDFDGKDWNEYHKYVIGIGEGWYKHKIPNGESLQDVGKRTGEALYELENKYRNKNILIVTHGGPAWLLFVNSGLYVPDNKPYKFPNEEAFVPDFKRFSNAEVRELPFIPIPHDENFELDLHKPYIDEAELICTHSTSSGQACGGELIRTKEVMDVWFDSGAMPFAQDHYPFDVKKIQYPADFISEAIDQTRGWFYTLHAIGVLMGRGKAFKNVICLGLLLDAKGKKMSKSLGNIVDSWEAMDKYGADTLRMWMYSVNQPGESKNFDEKTVALLHQQVFGLLYNVLAFYELYPAPEQARYGASRDKIGSSHILDKWILARLDELTELSTKNLDNYKLLEPVRGIREFIGDLSTWYLRRSRERIKEGDKEARQTLYFVLKNLAKVMAPFAPFTAEDIWLKLKTEDDAESVHLAGWPQAHLTPWPLSLIRRGGGERSVLKNMQLVREIVTLGLEARQKANIKVRQPLASLKLKVESLSAQAGVKLPSEYLDLIKDELNVKEIILEPRTSNLEPSVELDTKITPELKQEGDYRELARALQDMRKKLGLTPSDVVHISFETDDAGKKLIQKFKSDIKKTVLASVIELKANDGEAKSSEAGSPDASEEAFREIKIDNLVFKVKIEK